MEIQCGYLIVPEDRENPERTIRLHVAVVSSRSSTPAPDPVIFLAGGPGVYTLFFAHEHIETFEDILNERDLILFDQRGVGYSEPALDCPETEEARLANKANHILLLSLVIAVWNWSLPFSANRICDLMPVVWSVWVLVL